MRVEDRRFAHTTTQSSLDFGTPEIPLTAQSTAQIRPEQKMIGANDVGRDLNTNFEPFWLQERAAILDVFEDSPSSPHRSTVENPSLNLATSRFTDATHEWDSDHARTIPSFESKDPKWHSRTRHQGVDVSAAVDSSIEQGSLEAWALSRLLERVSASGISQVTLMKFTGSQFQTEQIPATEEVLAVIDQVFMEQDITH